MRLSAFNLYVPDFPAAGTTLVYNTFSGGFAEVDSPTIAALRKADAGKSLSVDEEALVAPEFFDEDLGILVEDRHAEELAYRAFHERRRSRTDHMSAIVSVTFACNLDCTYCCQNDVLDGTTMKPEVAEATAGWLADRALEVGARTLEVMFVGGEPLLHPGRIEQIVEHVRARVGDRVAFTFGLITNGMFLTRSLVEKWVPLGLVSAQVTLDGDESTHSITRRSKKRGEDSYRAIFDNVLAVSHLIRVTINGNYTEETAHGFVPLAKELAASGFPKGARVRFKPALNALGAPSDAAFGSCTWSGAAPELIISFNDEILRAGFDPGDLLEVGPCGFHRRHYYAIDPTGLIYKCPGFLGHANWSIGSVASGLNARYDALAGTNPQRECGSCAHRPECAGGCVATAWLAAGRVEGVNCEIGFFDRFQRDLVARKYFLQTSDTVGEAVERFPAPPISSTSSRNVVERKGQRTVALRVLAA